MFITLNDCTVLYSGIDIAMNKQKSLGHFENYDDAVQARIKAEKEMFGNFRYKGSEPIAELS